LNGSFQDGAAEHEFVFVQENVLPALIHVLARRPTKGSQDRLFGAGLQIKQADLEGAFLNDDQGLAIVQEPGVVSPLMKLGNGPFFLAGLCIQTVTLGRAVR